MNNRKSKTLRNGKLVEAKWSDVQVGDVIRLDNNQFVAADIMLLTTSEPSGLCFIETAELDGETNLKAKQCLMETTELGEQHDLLWSFNGEIICERPNNLLNKFEGTLIWRNQRFALDNDKILLRGCVLRNTQWCYGVVVFAGVDTKLMQNSGKTQFKSTGVDRLLNFIIIGVGLVGFNQIIRSCASLADCALSDIHMRILCARLRHLGGSDWPAFSAVFAVGAHHTARDGRIRCNGHWPARILLVRHSLKHCCANFPLCFSRGQL